MKFILSTILMLLSINSYAGWTGKWENKGPDAIIGLSSNPNNPSNAKNTVIAVGYFKNQGCKPVV